MRKTVAERLQIEFGVPSRDVVKVKSWELSAQMGVVLQMDQPNREDAAYIWLPYPGEGQTIPEIALEYLREAGRHSGTYPVAGLKRGEPVLKLTIRRTQDLDSVVDYIRAMASNLPLPEVKESSTKEFRAANADSRDGLLNIMLDRIDPALMPKVEPVKPRREAIPRLVQREVWQRDGGRCVECLTNALLCFDHIVPFSKGGSNSIRNIQLLCEKCNLSKSNRI